MAEQDNEDPCCDSNHLLIEKGIYLKMVSSFFHCCDCIYWSQNHNCCEILHSLLIWFSLTFPFQLCIVLVLYFPKLIDISCIGAGSDKHCSGATTQLRPRNHRSELKKRKMKRRRKKDMKERKKKREREAKVTYKVC